MIRVNLLGEAGNTRVTIHSPSYTNAGQTSIGNVTSPNNLDIVIKVLFAIGPLLVCLGAEQWTVGAKQQQLDIVKGELKAKQAEIQSKKKDVEQVQKFKEDKAQLDIRMNTIRDLSKARLKNVKALDAVQNIIPTRAWLLSLKLDEKMLELKGRAMEDNDISAFMEGLEQNIYFSQVVLISSASVKTDDGVVKEFSVRASLENL